MSTRTVATAKHKISLTLTLISTCHVIQCHGNNSFCFQFVTSTSPTLSYSHVNASTCLSIPLQQKCTSFPFSLLLFLSWQTFKRFASHSDGKQATKSYCKNLIYIRWLESIGMTWGVFFCSSPEIHPCPLGLQMTNLV